MSKRKGMSLDQKRDAMLQFFYRKKEFFHLKELGKQVPKETGMPSNTVEDVLKSLVDDNLVDCEKIGTSSFYWAFPSKATNAKKKELESLKSRLEESNEKLKICREKIIIAQVGREDTEKRQKLLQRIQTMKMDEERMTIGIQKFRDSDPESLEKMKKEIEIFKNADSRWSDNIEYLRDYCIKKGFDGKAFDKYLAVM